MRAGTLIPPSTRVTQRARVVADELPVPVDLDGLVTRRAEILGLHSNGRTSAGGSCRLLPTVDGWVAVNLARASDVEALPAVLEARVDADDPWPAVARYAANRPAMAVADRGQLLEVPVAMLDDPRVDARDAVRMHPLGAPRAPAVPPMVVDLSAMWAGPLCAHLLAAAGSRVVKVESTRRPDGARAGDPRFFEWLHAGHECVTLDFEAPEGRAALDRLLEQADVVIEGSRRRALAQLGIDADRFVSARPGRTWVSITGYGRSGPLANYVAFGDDAAVAGGLVACDHTSAPVFCADAIADPMSGLFAAAAAFRSIATGGGALVEITMAAVAKSLAREP